MHLLLILIAITKIAYLHQTFIFSTLSKFNLGCDFQKWVRLLYIEPRACVKNNGYFSPEFSLSRGVRQGCQVSCLIFILSMEVMSSYIRQNAKIKGLSLDENGSKNIKIIQYADDATLFLKTAQEMREEISSLEEFGKVAGTILNITKCEGLYTNLETYSCCCYTSQNEARTAGSQRLSSVQCICIVIAEASLVPWC